MVKRATWLWLILSLAACSQALTPGITPPHVPSATATITASTVASVPTATPVAVFGVELNQLSEAGGLPMARAAGALWLRRAGVWWPDVEPVEGEYHWAALAGMEAEFSAASASGARTILIVRGAPDWAQAKPGHACGPIASDKLNAFAKFMATLVARYSAPPYSVLYWELGNEPDIAPELVAPDSLFGCWGDDADPYYGGAGYAEMLRVVYPAIKAANPTAQVLIGGLLLDCNPALEGHCTNARPPRFLEGILRGGGGPYFDGVSFHAYDYYSPKTGGYGNPNWDSAWNTTGPVMTAKARFIRAALVQYNVADKFLINTESALICGRAGDEPDCQTETFAQAKATYVAHVYAAALAEGLRANVWYSFFGWRASGLVDAHGQPTLAYQAYQFAAQQLGAARFVRALDDMPDARGYEFQTGNRHLWILWSADGQPHTIVLHTLPLAWFTLSGAPQVISTSVSLTAQPVYIEWTAEAP